MATPTAAVAYGPAELRAAYAIPSSGGHGQTAAVCPRCHILLVEADTSNLANLVVAVGQAA